MAADSIIGHEKELNHLAEDINRDMMSPAYLLTGPEGVGKKIVALEFAKLLNCVGSIPGQRPCRECISCRKIGARTSPDVFVIVPEGRGHIITIDAVRDIKREANLKPYESSYKVFIIDDAESLTQESANSLLKILEESPAKNVFILITAYPERMLPTIVSRCRAMRFSVLAQETVERFLIQQHNVPHREACAIARFSGGRIGVAVRMKDSHMGDRKNAALDKVRELIDNRRMRFEAKLWEYQDRSRLKEDIAYIVSFFRDMAVYKVCGAHAEKHIVNSDRIQDITRISGFLSLDSLEDLIGRLIDLDGYIDRHANIKLVVDAIISALGDVAYAGSRTGQA
ncbi:MAG: DNA polymerase III subunit delta' [Candidatus Omnitrophica bacterium]|nr:DNA polymerase III subunit delta' [Candidatus Omnitrophota bacterium]